MSSKRRKPVLSLASVVHRQNASTGAAVPASSTSGGRKRKRVTSAQLISQFHQLQRQKDELMASKSKLSTIAFNNQLAAIEANVQALGGLEAYQQLSIQGHSSSKYQQFNSAHWIVDVLADAGLGLQALKGKHGASGGVSGPSTPGGQTPDEKKLAKRQKERERKRARKRAKREEEEQTAAAVAKAASTKKSAQGKQPPPPPAKPTTKQPAKKQVESDAEDESGDEEKQKDESEEEDEDIDDPVYDEEGGASTAASSIPAPVFSTNNRCKLLDVGAITNHYLPYSSHIDCMAIDLNPQHPSVKKKDFFELDFPALKHSFDVVVLSLVLNFVGDRFKRGEMIQRSVHLLKPTGHGRLFIVLPSACMKNSRWMNHELFVLKCMKPLGLRLGKFKYTTKLALFEFIREEVVEEEPVKVEVEPTEDAEGEGKPVSKAVVPVKPKKKGFQPAGIILEGETRNNFSICWRAEQ